MVPALVAGIGYRRQWRHAYLSMMATMLVDLDHLLASPVYDPLRCSIGFHPLHTWLPMVLYTGLTVYPGTRYLGLGLVIHMLLDALDCRINSGIWWV